MKSFRDYKVYLILIGIYIAVEALNRLDILNSYLLQILMVAGINIIMTISLNIVNGFTGQFSIGQAGFMGIGAYASAVVTTLLFRTASWPPFLQVPVFLLALAIGGIVAAVFGFLIGAPSLKLKGDYLAIVTLGFGELLRAGLRLINYVGGPRGLTGIPRYTNLFWVFLFTILAIYAARNFINSSFGRACIAIRENEVAAETMGVDTTKYKIISFTFAAFMSGIAGGLFGHLMMFLQPDTFSFMKSIDYLVFLYAGGMSSISGSIMGAGILTAVPEFMRFLANWRIVIYSVLLVILMLKRPKGLYGGKEFGFLKPPPCRAASKGRRQPTAAGIGEEPQRGA
jgi:branched-chain amino acid transport system permease protein